jgi:mannosyltransferase
MKRVALSMNLIPRIARQLRTPHILILIALCAVAAGLSFYRLGYHSLWCDEAVSFFIGDDNVSSILRHSLTYDRPLIDVNPPLYWLLLHFVLNFGSSEWWLRFPSAVFGILLIPVLYFLWRRLFTVEIALLAVAFVAFSPAFIFYCQNARVYTLMLLLFYLAYSVLLKALKSENLWHWRIYSALVLVSLYTTYLTAFLIVTSVCIVALWSLYGSKMGRKKIKQTWLRFTIAVLIACGLAVPAGPGYLFARSLSHTAEQPFTENFLRSFRDEYFWLHDWRFYALAALIAGGLVYGVLRHARSTVLTALLIFIPAMFAEVSRPLHFVPRHILVILPALMLLLALGVAMIAHAVAAALSLQRHQQRLMLIIFAASAGLYLAAYSNSIRWHYTVPMQNWRDAVPYVKERAQPGDTIVTGLFYVEYCFLYYDRFSWFRYNFKNRVFNYELFKEELLAPKRVWYITAFQNQIPEKFQTVLRENFECLKIVRGRLGAPDIYIYFRDGSAKKSIMY